MNEISNTWYNHSMNNQNIVPTDNGFNDLESTIAVVSKDMEKIRARIRFQKFFKYMSVVPIIGRLRIFNPLRPVELFTKEYFDHLDEYAQHLKGTSQRLTQTAEKIKIGLDGLLLESHGAVSREVQLYTRIIDMKSAYNRITKNKAVLGERLHKMKPNHPDYIRVKENFLKLSYQMQVAAHEADIADTKYEAIQRLEIIRENHITGLEANRCAINKAIAFVDYQQNIHEIKLCGAQEFYESIIAFADSVMTMQKMIEEVTIYQGQQYKLTQALSNVDPVYSVTGLVDITSLLKGTSERQMKHAEKMVGLQNKYQDLKK